MLVFIFKIVEIKKDWGATDCEVQWGMKQCNLSHQHKKHLSERPSNYNNSACSLEKIMIV